MYEEKPQISDLTQSAGIPYYPLFLDQTQNVFEIVQYFIYLVKNPSSKEETPGHNAAATMFHCWFNVLLVKKMFSSNSSTFYKKILENSLYKFYEYINFKN